MYTKTDSKVHVITIGSISCVVKNQKHRDNTINKLGSSFNTFIIRILDDLEVLAF